jgi:cell fate (sporulation/competence/biofilm development) regulator YlbF (YheA/YmcA/DUF963 family)
MTKVKWTSPDGVGIEEPKNRNYKQLNKEFNMNEKIMDLIKKNRSLSIFVAIVIVGMLVNLLG